MKSIKNIAAKVSALRWMEAGYKLHATCTYDTGNSKSPNHVDNVYVYDVNGVKVNKDMFFDLLESMYIFINDVKQHRRSGSYTVINYYCIITDKGKQYLEGL